LNVAICPEKKSSLGICIFAFIDYLQV